MAVEARRLSAVDRAYLAGLLDGDGYIVITCRRRERTQGDRRRGVSFELFAKIGGEPQHLTQLKQAWGVGSLWIRKRKGQRHLAEWIVAGIEVRSFLACLLPYLRLKRRQAELVAKFPHCRSRWDSTPELRRLQVRCWKEMRRLNHRVGRGKLADRKQLEALLSQCDVAIGKLRRVA